MSFAWLAAAPLWLAAYELGRRRLPGPRRPWPRWRRACAWGAAGALVPAFALAPPGFDKGQLWAETLQFCLLAFAVTPLAVLAAPVALARRARPGSIAGKRRSAPGRDGLRSMVLLAGFLGVTVLWRLPIAVDALARHPSLVGVEAATLLAGGSPFWEAIAAAPGHRLVEARPARLVMAAVGVWSVWIFAYIVGFSGHPFYPAYRSGTNPVTAQEWAVLILWLTSAAAILPQVFANLVRWLAADRLVGDAEVTLYLEHRPELGRHPGAPPARPPVQVGQAASFWSLHPRPRRGAHPWDR